MKNLLNKLKTTALIAVCASTLLPSIANADSNYDSTSTYQYKEPLVTVEFSDIEKKIMNAKGFDYRYDLGNNYDYYNGNIPINKDTMKQINDWAKEAYRASRASNVNGEKNKARLMAAYLATYYPYDLAAVESNDYLSMLHASSLTSIPFRGKAACMGYSYMLVRMLDVIGIESYNTMACMKDPDGTNPGYHSVVRAKLDGKWTTIETTGTVEPTELYQVVASGENVDSMIFPKAYQVSSEKELYKVAGKTKYRYEVVVDKEIENYLTKNNFMIYDY